MEGPGKDFKERTLKSIKQGLGRLWRRRSVTITDYDPTFKVSYLGNVLTGWAKGEGCIEKPLCTLWKNYQTTAKPDVQMKVTVTQSGLKAVTKEHGLTEYWSHRITYCTAPANYPKVFCWVYRHEGRKLKQELRCHAVICSKESVARRMAHELSFKLAQALSEFKRDKISKQNARLSLANSVYDNPSLPRRKILLSTGSQNYRPPLERSKSAPKLMSIEESVEEEEEAPEVKRNVRCRERSLTLNKVDEVKEEEDPFSGDVWGKDGVHVQGDFDGGHSEDFPRRVSAPEARSTDECGEETKEEEEERVESDPHPNGVRSRPVDANGRDLLRMSWGGEDMSDRVFSQFPDYEETGSRAESGLGSYRSDDSSLESYLSLDRKSETKDDTGCSLTSFVHFDGLLDHAASNLEAAFTKLYLDLDYLEEESTPSLQSISSGSDGSGRALKHHDLDSLSEEDSDESGFAEAVPQDGADDKIRDLPHHQLMKSCILSTKSHCLQV